MIDLFYLAIIWACVFISSFLAVKTKTTSVLYFLFTGCILVNIGVLPAKSPEFIKTFSELGIIIIMFALGFEENSKTFVGSVKRSWGVALFGAVVPFLTVYSLTFWFWQDQKIAITCGLAMTATAVSLTMVTLKNEGLGRSTAATAIMSSAVLDDIASLVLLAAIIPLITTGATFTFSALGFILIKAVLFFLIVTLLGLWIFPGKAPKCIKKYQFVFKYGIKDLFAFQKGEQITLIILFVALTTSLLAYIFGFHPAIGAYMAGLILKDEYFSFSNKKNDKKYNQTKKVIDDIAFSWIGPVFFVELGSHLIFERSVIFAILPHAILLTIALFIGQVISAGLAARYTGNFDKYTSLIIGFGMLGRAELAFVVMDIGYIQYSILSKEAFYTLMFVAFWLNIAVPLTIRGCIYYRKHLIPP